MEVKRYSRIFLQAAYNRFAMYVHSRSDVVTFLTGKFVRMGFFFLLAFSLFRHTNAIAGYNQAQIIFFFAVMNLVDELTQAIWYRGMYSLKDFIRFGKFDVFLIQPVSPLFKIAAMQVDVFDIIALPAVIGYVVYAWLQLPTQPEFAQALLGAGLFLLSMLIVFGINLTMSALAFWTTETDNAWSLYRDAIYVSRFPPEILPTSIRSAFTFLVPVLVIVSVPVKAIFGTLTPTLLIWSVVAACLWITIGLLSWKAGLRHYTSASG